MPIDRAATLRNAEKLIRQGKVPDAAVEKCLAARSRARLRSAGTSDAGSSRDVDERIERLTKVQAGS